MTTRVRFAPSPTGQLHIGGARTALYSYLFAKATGGIYILRIEDTDLERSKREYELAQIDDLKWLGITHDEGPNVGGDFGPYRQSERTEIYQKYADQLIDSGHAFYCFCTDKELEEKRKKAEEEKRDPHYDGACYSISKEEAKERIANGEKPTIRFKAIKKEYGFQDLIRGKVSWPMNMVGDFVIIRSNGLPTYNYCCVIDDWQMKMTHVFRAEDHLNNTLRQLMIYEALNAPVPEFAHFSLIIGHDRQKLSKRHGTTSVSLYKNEGYLPEGLVNYISLLGWSHPDEKDVFTTEEIVPLFDLKRFSKSSAMYDFQKLKYINGQHLKGKESKTLLPLALPYLPKETPFHQMGTEWQESFIEFFKEKAELLTDFSSYLNLIFSSDLEDSDGLKDIFSWETTPKIYEYVKEKLEELKNANVEYVNQDDFGQWSNTLKKEMKIKGKPLFMGLRGVLTGVSQGPDLKGLIPLTPLNIILERLEKERAKFF